MSSPSPSFTRRNHSNEDDEQPASSGVMSLVMNIVAAPLRPIRSVLPHMFPLLICLLCIPVLMLFSGAAGWVVWKNVPVGWKAEAYLQYGDSMNPFSTTLLPPILADQPYDISLHLVIPATESNYALGNFMATMKLTTAYNESITTVRRSTTLVPPHSSLLKQILLGSPSTIKVEVPLLYEFISGTSTVNARLELGRSDGWRGVGNGQGRELSVFEATLKGTVRPTGIRAILARYPRITTFISSFTFFFISLVVVSITLLIAIRPGSSSSHEHSPTLGGDANSDDGGDDDGSYPTARLVTKRRMSRRDSNSTDNTPDEDKDSGNGLQLSGLRKRRSTPSIRSLDTTKRQNQVKIEVNDDTVNFHSTPSKYPRSPFPRNTSADSSGSIQKDTVSPVDVDLDSRQFN